MNFYWSIELSLSLSLDQSLLNNSDLIKRDKLSSQHGAHPHRIIHTDATKCADERRRRKIIPLTLVPRKLHEKLRDGKLHTLPSKSLRHESLGESGVSKRLDLDKEAQALSIGP